MSVLEEHRHFGRWHAFKFVLFVSFCDMDYETDIIAVFLFVYLYFITNLAGNKDQVLVQCTSR